MSRTIQPVKTEIVDSEDTAAAKRIMEAYHDAVQGLRKVIVCGAVLLQEKGRVGHGSFLDWLKKNCPTIPIRTAQHWMQLSDGVMTQIKMRNCCAFAEILSLPEPEIKDEKAKKVREKVFNLIDGKSQRQLMFEFKNFDPKPRGGARSRSKEDLPDVDSEAQAALDVWKPTLAFLEVEGLKEKSWAHLERKHLEALHGLLIDLSREVGKAVKK